MIGINKNFENSKKNFKKGIDKFFYCAILKSEKENNLQKVSARNTNP